MSLADRPLSFAVIKVLTCWPGIVGGNPPTAADLALLPPFFNELLDELPWWNQAWRVTQVEPAYPLEIASNQSRTVTRFTEVSVPGTVSRDAGEELPFSARVRFKDNRLTRFQAKIGDVILGPGSTAAGKREPHPFGVVLTQLMKLRGISIMEMATRCGRAQSTIRGVCSGSRNPHRILVAELAEGLGMPEEDLLAIAGLDVHP
ncbi:helix-turn-helix domain-containing protein [Dactylosporangium sp. CA-092794]|uniref:helix-turn-helix domain-containing protein n=1 Tax=Dactylosporangium sp. CA-092794 TaxID=3239929 RepID=UPI003D8D6E9D